MKAVITGASSGLGRDMAIILSEMGYDIVAIARREELLEDLKKQAKTNVITVCADVTKKEDIEKISAYLDDADVFINNAGFGVFGSFCESSLEDELRMLDTNVKAVHILTKLSAKKFKEKNKGHILNVASVAAFFPGPLFGAYYSTKAYVFRLTEALYEELKQEKSNVRVSVLCPGPVKTGFEQVAGVSFGSGDEPGRDLIISDSKKVSRYAIKMMFKGKLIIVPGLLMKIAVFARRILSEKMLCKFLYILQSKKFVK
ncbi:MAG: SDR family NAD(P)-dependent oxidoreductase [Ruminococcaceae bacterium]|nr:SDR family NAD(P)-dependent oxidoreductase [Oscillospiraceae bacterium]